MITFPNRYNDKDAAIKIIQYKPTASKWGSSNKMDGLIASISFFIFHRCHVVYKSMLALSIVKKFNVFKNALSGLYSCLVIFMIDKFIFQGFEKTFSNCIIQTLTFTANATTKLVIG